MKKKITVELLREAIDFTMLAPNAKEADYLNFFEKARKFGFRRVFVSPSRVAFAGKHLEGMIIGTTSGFPHGTETIEAKVFSARKAIEEGALEIDFVMNIGKALDGDFKYLKREFQAMADLKENVRDPKFNLKVILEICYLDPQTIRDVVSLAVETGIDFVKTSTGYGLRGATVEDVCLLRESAGDRVKIKASGGIRTLKQTVELIEAGADRIGTSSGDQILLEAAATLPE